MQRRAKKMKVYDSFSFRVLFFYFAHFPIVSIFFDKKNANRQMGKNLNDCFFYLLLPKT